ncbi:hypothetical protein K8R33_00760 [archaeon]|nr:hypothetical protein [archaeon]
MEIIIADQEKVDEIAHLEVGETITSLFFPFSNNSLKNYFKHWLRKRELNRLGKRSGLESLGDLRFVIVDSSGKAYEETSEGAIIGLTKTQGTSSDPYVGRLEEIANGLARRLPYAVILPNKRETPVLINMLDRAGTPYTMHKDTYETLLNI